MRQDLLSQRAEVDRNEHTVAESDMELKKAESEWYSEISARIVEDRKQLQAVEEELVKAQEKNRLSRITAPIDGVVQIKILSLFVPIFSHARIKNQSSQHAILVR